MPGANSQTGEISAAARFLQYSSEFALRAAFVLFFGGTLYFAGSFGYCRELFLLSSGILFLISGMAGCLIAGKKIFSGHGVETIIEGMTVLILALFLTGSRIASCSAFFLLSAFFCGFLLKPGGKRALFFWTVSFLLFFFLREGPLFLYGLYALILSAFLGSSAVRHSWKRWILHLMLFLGGTVFIVQVIYFVPKRLQRGKVIYEKRTDQLSLFFGLAQLSYQPNRILHLSASFPEGSSEAWKEFPELQEKRILLSDPESVSEKLQYCRSVSLIILDCPLPDSLLNSLYLSERFLSELQQKLKPDGVLIVRFPNDSARRSRLTKEFAENQLMFLFREVKSPPGFRNILLCGENICVEPETLEKYNEQHHRFKVIPPNLMEVLQLTEPAKEAVFHRDRDFDERLLFWRFFLDSEMAPSLEIRISDLLQKLYHFRLAILFFLPVVYLSIRYFRSGALPQKKKFRSFELGIWLGIFAGIFLNKFQVLLIPGTGWYALFFACFFFALFCFHGKSSTFAQRFLSLFLPWGWLFLIPGTVNLRSTECLIPGGGVILALILLIITAYAAEKDLSDAEQIPLISGGCAGVLLTALLGLTAGGCLSCAVLASLCAILNFKKVPEA